jgi:multimeric flavodoxin WrbA
MKNQIRICALQGSPRGMKSRTRKLIRFVLSGAEEEGADIELIDLPARKIEACTACDACALTGRCVFNDDFLSIVQMMKSSDGIVLGSPVYIDNVSGQMKVFVDRLADCIHYQVLTGKYGCAVATTWSSGGEEVVSYLNHVINYLGAQALPGIWAALEEDDQAINDSEERARQLGGALVGAIRAGTRFPEQLRIIEENRAFFARIVTANREWRKQEYDEWITRGWI